LGHPAGTDIGSNVASVVKAIEGAGGKAIAIQAGAADAEAIKGAVEKTVAAFGGLDVLVNNAGTAIPKTFEETTLEGRRVGGVRRQSGVLVHHRCESDHRRWHEHLTNEGICIETTDRKEGATNDESFVELYSAASKDGRLANPPGSCSGPRT